ncbi:MAG: NERD domain-containing protein [Clostridia bacterium]|nr:NERD domain-containing protein [Clostridia bacterium]
MEDYLYIILPVLFVVFLILIILIKRLGRYTPEEKGAMGEKMVAQTLGGTIEGEQYLINDIILTDGKTTCQIDHVFINRYGIWVIETKNYAGMIYGQENSNSWTQVLAYGNTKNRLYNPIKQNNTHIHKLNKIVKLKIELFNVVVFANNEVDLSNVNARNVFYLSQLKQVVSTSTGLNLGRMQMEEYYNRILSAASTNVSMEEHIENIHTMQKQVANNICPRCGGNLIKRNGKHGPFMGCSNYPKCTFIKK